MKALFESKFPFVKQDDADLTKEQLDIKKYYDQQYIANLEKQHDKETIKLVTGSIPKEEKTDKLREVHVNATGIRKRTK